MSVWQTNKLSICISECLTDWQTKYMYIWVFDWLTNWVYVYMSVWLTDKLSICISEYLTDWQTEYVVYWLKLLNDEIVNEIVWLFFYQSYFSINRCVRTFIGHAKASFWTRLISIV